MKIIFSKTTLGLLVALGLVLLFYARMLGEAQGTLDKARQSAATRKKEAQATADTAAQRHRELVSALRATQRLGAPATAAVAKTTLASTDSIKRLQIELGETPDGIPGARTQQAMRAAAARRNALPAITPAPQATQLAAPPAAQPWGTVALLLGLGAVAYLGYAGWRESTQQLVEADPNDRDTQLLELLMGAFAGVIGRALPIPRQVKRFASKARLQHNLLGQLADETRHTSRFNFDAAQQVLAFLLLLLLEDRAAPTSGRATPLRELDEDDFVVTLRERFLAWHRTCADSRVYARFEQQAHLLAVPTYADLPALLNEAEADRLLIQLHRLNAGLLV
jgi:hypothetical protein